MSRIESQFENSLDETGGQVSSSARSHNGLLCLAESHGGLVHNVKHNLKIDIHVKSTEYC